MKVGDLVQFKTGIVGAIVEVHSDFGGYALVWIAGDVTFPNPTHMNLETLEKSARIIMKKGEDYEVKHYRS